MEKFHVEFEMTQKDELPVEASSFSEAVTKAGESIGPDWRPVSVCDGSEVRYVIGKCEGCLKWITEGGTTLREAIDARMKGEGA